MDLNELSKETLQSYLKKAIKSSVSLAGKEKDSEDKAFRAWKNKRPPNEYLKHVGNKEYYERKKNKRIDGIDMAGGKTEYKEDLNSLISAVAMSEPSSFSDQFHDIVIKKIETMIEDYRKELSQNMYGPKQIDELSGSKLGSYIVKARSDIENRGKNDDYSF